MNNVTSEIEQEALIAMAPNLQGDQSARIVKLRRSNHWKALVFNILCITIWYERHGTEEELSEWNRKLTKALI